MMWRGLQTYSRSRAYSIEQVGRLRAVLGEKFKGANCVVGVNGSFARKEASPESDLDLFCICLDAEKRDEVDNLLSAARADIRAVVPKGAAEGGAFDKVEPFGEILKNIGGPEDMNEKITRRILFLLEGEWLFNESGFAEVRDKIIEKYIRESIDDHQIALFLLNDVIRYYRTICVDFENKTIEGGKPWGIRNIKLVFSRKLLYYSGVLAVAETYRRTWREKRKRLSHLLSLSPVERILEICGDRAIHSLHLYDEFLQEMGRSEVRSACEKITEADRDESELFRYLKNKGHEFTGRLISLLNATYDSGHPIHRSLIL
jgi:hypothetical protein